MSRLSVGAILSVLLLISGCGPIQRTVLHDEHLKIYNKIFTEEKPQDVEVIHSLLVNYTPRIGVVTSTDFEIELIAPEQWILEKSEKLHLKKVEDENSYPYEIFSTRKERANDWYAPKDISKYDLYYLYITSIPYIHMLVDKEQVGEDQHRVFVSKH